MRGGPVNEWLRALLSILAVLALALAVRRWAWRGRMPALRRTWRGRARSLEALDRLALSPQHTLHLVRVGDRALLIGAHPGGCTVLESLPAASLPAAETVSPRPEGT
jgi:flagellar biogenesis protein FliO